MSKALIEKAFDDYIRFYHCTAYLDVKEAFIAGATWQREQLEAEIKELKEQVTDLTNGNYKKGIHTMEQLHRIVEDRNKTIDWWTNKGFEDLDKIKDLQAENKTIREQLIKELREWIESNKELRGYTGIPDDTLNIILAKLDLLEKGGE